MPRSSPRIAAATLIAVAFGACRTAVAPLPLHDPFPVDYTGTIAPAAVLPATAAEAPDAEVPEPLVAGAPDRVFSVRATFVELPLDELRRLIPDWLEQGNRARGYHLAGDELARRLVDWRARDLVQAQAFLAASPGCEASVRRTRRTAFVSHLDLRGSAAACLVDPAVSAFEHGLELAVTPRWTAGELTLAFTWRNRDRVLPRPVGKVREGRLGAIELPLLIDQTMSGDAPMREGSATVLGAMVGRDEDAVILLCLEADAPADGVRTASAR